MREGFCALFVLETDMDLKQFFSENRSVALAFSGGVDSAYLLYAAVKAGVRLQAYFVKSAFQPAFELEDARRLAEELGADMKVLELDVLSDEAITSNPSNRCYHCKKRIFSAILEAARDDGFTLLIDGSNASDDASDRPGMKALEELSVRSPLREAGLSKAEVRRLSREAGLFTHDKPAYACLATRIPTGEPINAEKLLVTELSEAYLSSLGLRDFRVRRFGGAARLQLRQEDLPLVMQNRETILNELKEYYSGVMLDLEVRL